MALTWLCVAEWFLLGGGVARTCPGWGHVPHDQRQRDDESQRRHHPTRIHCKMKMGNATRMLTYGYISPTHVMKPHFFRMVIGHVDWHCHGVPIRKKCKILYGFELQGMTMIRATCPLQIKKKNKYNFFISNLQISPLQILLSAIWHYSRRSVFWNSFSYMKIVAICFKFPFSKAPISNKTALLQILAWFQQGNKPLSELILD